LSDWERFPGEYARTRRYTLGEPRNLRVSPDGSRVVFLRSSGGEDPVNGLWVLDTASGHEQLVADPRRLRADDSADEEPADERALRERRREAATGVTGYATDRDVRTAAFALVGRLFVCDLVAGTVEAHEEPSPCVDPRPDPSGQRIAYVRDRRLHVVAADGGGDRCVVGDDDPEVSWGLAEFVAAEEMRRSRGFWWAPDGRRLAVARVDTATVARWYLADASDPASAPRSIAYPAAGTANASVSLHVVDLEGDGVGVDWDAETFPYLVAVEWGSEGPLTVVLQSRDQRHQRIVAVDPDSGATQTVREDHDRDWVEIVPGTPRWLAGGRLVHTLDGEGARRLAVDGKPVTGPHLQVREVLGADAGPNGRVLVSASLADPTVIGVWQIAADAGAELVPLTPPEGVHTATGGSRSFVCQSRSLTRAGVHTVVRTPNGDSEIASMAADPALAVRVELLRLGDRDLRAALVLPTWHIAGRGALPVLLDPYGGPHAQRAVQRRDAFYVSQWFADAGFAVLVADGRGTPGRGPAWERAVAGSLADAPLEDQVDALHAAAAERPELDLDRVAIRGWSFGGFLAALAVLRRPDVFHAAIAGSPVTDWRLYDTHYTERYLGQPQDNPAAYEQSSLLADAPRLSRPLLLVHGIDDDNVVVAHTLRLSRALVAAGRPHAVLPIPGITHHTGQHVAVSENLLRLQLAFLRDALGLSAHPAQ
jgi:dipeptidyl-peptidase 4